MMNSSPSKAECFALRGAAGDTLLFALLERFIYDPCP